MKNKKAEEVIKKLEEETRHFVIKVLGDKENKVYAFAILMHSEQGFGGTEKEIYSGISKETIDLLNEAEIKFKIL